MAKKKSSKEEELIEEVATVKKEKKTKVENPKKISEEQNNKSEEPEVTEEVVVKNAKMLKKEKHAAKIKAMDEARALKKEKKEAKAALKKQMIEQKLIEAAKNKRVPLPTISTIDAERFNPDVNEGLTSEQVKKRVNAGLINHKQTGSTKSIKKIVFSNLFTFFNILMIAIAGWLISVGAIRDLMFVVIVTLNIVIGIIQEIRAKKTIDKLSILSSPTANVVRDGKEYEIAVNEIVLDDVIALATGKQICSDSIVMEGSIEVNESLLTGESDAIVKKPGDALFSGSFVVSGKCKAKVNAIGKDNYIEKLTLQAKKYGKPKSQLLKALTKIVKFMAVIIIPLGATLFLMQYKVGDVEYAEAVRNTCGAMIGMIPSGLFLLTSIALAVGVMKLAQNNVLVQELYCIEMLARVDVLCLDKTGTITDGTMAVKNVIEYTMLDGLNTKSIVSAVINATNDKNMTNTALEEKFGRGKRIKHTALIPFSSQRKYSAVTFDKLGTYIIGAPEFVMTKNYNIIANDVNVGAKQGYRVLLVAHTKASIVDGSIDTSNLTPISLIEIEDTVRADAIKTISYFKESGVEVKVISGDNPVTVAKVSERAGIENANDCISLDGLSDAEVVRAATKYTVFGRVSPAQKKLLVETLKQAGKTVAMTGDGVNDILALKEADCSIAVASGSEAARNVSHLVLLDSNFDSMPKVVAEGRRVINNVAKVACLFLTKTIFSLLLAIYALRNSGMYPIKTIQLTMIDILCIGLPSFVLVLEPNNKKAEGDFLANILKGALPGALAILLNSAIVFAFANTLNMNYRDCSTIIVIVATFTCMMVLFQTCRPFSTIKKALFGTMFTLYLFFTLFLPRIFEFSPITSVGEYYSNSEEVKSLYMPSITLSSNDHYVVNGYYTSLVSDGTEIKAVNDEGYISINNKMTGVKVTPRISMNLDEIFYVLEGTKIDIEYDKDYKMKVGSNGDIYINGTKTRYNILPEVKIDDDGTFIVNNVDTGIETDISSVNSVSIEKESIYVNGESIGKKVDMPLVSKYEGYFYLGGFQTSNFISSSFDVTVNENLEYILNDNKIANYNVSVITSENGHYVLDGEYTSNVIKDNRNEYIIAVDDDGYLEINGTSTDYIAKTITHKGGQVAKLSLSMMLLMVCLVMWSWPLIAVFKNFVPWIKRQIVVIRKLISKL